MYDEPDWSSFSVVELLEKAQEIAKQACGKSLSSYAFIDRALDKMLNGTKDGEELTELMGKAQRVYQIIIEQQGITQITETVLATWHIRSRKDGLGLPDHSYPWARNSIEGQGKRVLLAV